jgi:hypothetical protein
MPAVRKISFPFNLVTISNGPMEQNMREQVLIYHKHTQAYTLGLKYPFSVSEKL